MVAVKDNIIPTLGERRKIIDCFILEEMKPIPCFQKRFAGEKEQHSTTDKQGDLLRNMPLNKDNRNILLLCFVNTPRKKTTQENGKGICFAFH